MSDESVYSIPTTPAAMTSPMRPQAWTDSSPMFCAVGQNRAPLEFGTITGQTPPRLVWRAAGASNLGPRI